MADLNNFRASFDISNTNTATIIHNLNSDYLGLQIVIEGVARPELISSISVSPTDPKNVFIVDFTQNVTGNLQVFQPTLQFVTLPESVESTKNTFTEETRPPTTTDDENSRQSIGSRWVDTSTDLYYVCQDNTANNAVWLPVANSEDTRFLTQEENDFLGLTATTGWLSGGGLTFGTGLDVNVASGTGYINTGGVVSEISWNATTLTLTANEQLEIFVDSNGTVTFANSFPDLEASISLGSALTTNIVNFLVEHNVELEEKFAKQHIYAKEVVGPIGVSGCIASINGSNALSVNVSNGVYYLYDQRNVVTGNTPVTFTYWYRDGSGAFTPIVNQTVLSNSQYDDGSGTLASLPTVGGEHRRDLLYVARSGAGVSYHIILGQEVFDSLNDAEVGNNPSAPPIVNDNALRAAAIIVEQGGNIAAIIDERPRLGQLATGVNTANITSHGDLTDLLNDDHLQYLLVNGSRAMTGSLDMGAQNITNVGQVDGVDVSAHASRHLPNGADPLTTATPVTVGTTNAIGNANSFARSNHVHAHGDQAGGSLHALSTPSVAGFMSASDKTKLDTIGFNADVEGPNSATDNAVARFDTTTGKLIQNSGVLVSDTNAVSGVSTLTVNGSLLAGHRLSVTGAAGDNGISVRSSGNGSTTPLDIASSNGSIEYLYQDNAGLMGLGTRTPGYGVDVQRGTGLNGSINVSGSFYYRGNLLSLDNLADVDLTTNAPVANQLLQFDGTNFVPEFIGRLQFAQNTTTNQITSNTPVAIPGLSLSLIPGNYLLLLNLEAKRVNQPVISTFDLALGGVLVANSRREYEYVDKTYLTLSVMAAVTVVTTQTLTARIENDRTRAVDLRNKFLAALRVA